MTECMFGICLAVIAQNAIEFPVFEPNSSLPFGTMSIRKDPKSGFIFYERSASNVPSPPLKDIEELNRLRTGEIFSPDRMGVRSESPLNRYRTINESKVANSSVRLGQKRAYLKKKAEERKKKQKR